MYLPAARHPPPPPFIPFILQPERVFQERRVRWEDQQGIRGGGRLVGEEEEGSSPVFLVHRRELNSDLHLPSTSTGYDFLFFPLILSLFPLFFLHPSSPPHSSPIPFTILPFPNLSIIMRPARKQSTILVCPCPSGLACLILCTPYIMIACLPLSGPLHSLGFLPPFP